MADYLRVLDDGRQQVWRIDDQVAVQLGVSNPEEGAGTYFQAERGRTALEVMAERTPWFQDGRSPFTALRLPTNRYHPRIARPLAVATTPKIETRLTELDRTMLASAKGQAAVLTAELSRICRTIHPVEQTLDTFGHDIRNLLILASTEAEMSWRAVLTANGASKLRPTVQDYRKLGPILRLPAYAIRFNMFPWLPAIRPFEAWNRDAASGRLDWYAAYNAVKHDREGRFDLATLRHAFEAVTACAILLVAQFGRQNGLGQGTDLSRFFHFEREPEWPLDEYYSGFAVQPGDEWMPTPHPELAAIGDRPRLAGSPASA